MLVCLSGTHPPASLSHGNKEKGGRRDERPTFSSFWCIDVVPLHFPYQSHAPLSSFQSQEKFNNRVITLKQYMIYPNCWLSKNDLLLDKFEDEFVLINVQRILALIQAKNPGWVLLKAKSLFTWYEQLTWPTPCWNLFSGGSKPQIVRLCANWPCCWFIANLKP